MLEGIRREEGREEGGGGALYVIPYAVNSDDGRRDVGHTPRTFNSALWKYYKHYSRLVAAVRIRRTKPPGREARLDEEHLNWAFEKKKGKIVECRHLVNTLNSLTKIQVRKISATMKSIVPRSIRASPLNRDDLTASSERAQPHIFIRICTFFFFFHELLRSISMFHM